MSAVRPSCCHVDIETFSSVDIKLGVHKYVEAEDFEVLLIAWAVDDEPVQVVDLMRGPMPDALARLLVDPKVVKIAFNAIFETTCLATMLPIDVRQWGCAAALARSHGLLGNLDTTAKELGLGADELKDKRGKKLIDFFCHPCRPTKSNGGRTRNLPEYAPKDWATFIEYNRQDVVTERAVFNALRAEGWAPTRTEHRVRLLDQAINARGAALDVQLVRAALDRAGRLAAELRAEAEQLTGLANPNSVAQLRGWLAERGVDIPDLAKETVLSFLAGPLPDDARRALELRLQMGMSSLKKYEAAQRVVCRDGRARDLTFFFGAHTGRWAGRQLQLQNLPRTHLDDIDGARRALLAGEDVDADTLSQLVRTVVVAPPGHKLIVSDFSAIEARVTAWLCNETWRLEAFRDGLDIYCASASKMFGVPVEKHGVNADLRQRGKVAELALGYGGGVGALKKMAGDKLRLSDREFQRIVDLWRRSSPKVVKLWKALDRGCRLALSTGAPLPIGSHLHVGRSGPHLIVKLPSGRPLFYRHARACVERGRPGLEFRGLDQLTHRPTWVRTYGARCVENVVQGIARDLLAEAMLRLEAHGYAVVGHVHDEVILEVPDEPRFSLDEVNRLMSTPPDWADGLPLAADGFESPYYKK